MLANWENAVENRGFRESLAYFRALTVSGGWGGGEERRGAAGRGEERRTTRTARAAQRRAKCDKQVSDCARALDPSRGLAYLLGMKNAIEKGLHMERIRACVVGATGYAGIEVCRLVLSHPALELVMVTDRKEAGTRLDALYPSMAGACDLVLVRPDAEAIAAAADVAFLAVPHTASLALTPKLLELGVTVLDLSADYRLHDASVYEAWYATPHTSPELLKETVYGLPELNRSGLAALAQRRPRGEAVLVAVPGCYPTATALAAAPALEQGLATGDLVIADAISGVSGAGRGCNARTHFCHANESVEAYGVAKHRHTPEIEQTLSEVAGREMSVVFTPHLAPLTRGLLSTVYLEAAPGVTSADVQAAYERAYANEPLVTALPAGQMPATSSVFGTARAQVGVALDDRRRRTIIASCAIDNLGKGAAAQAIQCANAVLGLPETAGLLAPAPLV